MAEDPSFEQRAARRRATWRASLGTSGPAMRVTETTAEERLAVMGELAEAGWALLGRPFPEYTRATMPGRVIRPGEAS